MSKRNRNKFRHSTENRPAVATGTPAMAAPARSSGATSMAQSHHAAEYKIISRDLIRLVVLNGLMLLAVLALYYVNKSSGVVEKLYSQIF